MIILESSMKKISIQQPEHMPWLGFLDKVRQVDEVILLDNVQFKKGYFDNRNRIKDASGSIWITIPVKTNKCLNININDVEIDNSQKWGLKCFKQLQCCYGKSKYWNEYSCFFKELYSKKWNKLVDLNITIIKYILDEFGLNKKIILASDMDVKGTSTELLLNICEKRNANVYLSGAFGKEYLEISKFDEKNIKVDFQEFKHPIYEQQFGSFISNMSAVDLLFNYGKDSINIINNNNNNNNPGE